MDGGAPRANGNERNCRIPSSALIPLAMLALVALLAWAQPADALTLLSIRDFSQSVGLSYRFRHATIGLGQEQTEETEQNFAEDYGVGFKYSLLSPLLLKGTASLNLEWEQEMKDSADSTRRGSDFQLRYNINGILLEKRPYPVVFSTFSSRDTVSQSFLPSYDSVRDGFNVRLAILNRFAPASISLDRQTQETSGLNQNIRQAVNTYLITANPTLAGIASFNLSATKTDSSATALDSNLTSDYSSASARAGGQRGWKSERGLSRNLAVLYNYHASAGTIPRTAHSISANQHWQLGKALDATLRYLWNTSRATLSRLDTQSGALTLTHQLFSSVTTTVSLAANDSRYSEGADRSYSGGGGIAYTKELPESSRLNLAYTFGLGRNERTGRVSELNILDEEHPIPTVIPRRITLAQPTFNAAGIKVVGAQTLLAYPDSFFEVVSEGVEITQFFTGDSAVLISYTYRVDPAVITSSLSQGVSSSLSLFRGKYLLHANYRSTDQELVKGNASLLSLTDSLHYDAGMTARYLRHSFGAELGYDKNFAQDLHYLATSWSYAAPVAKGNLTVSATDRYAWREVSGADSDGSEWTNSFNLRSEYRRPVGFLAGRLKLEYANSIIDGGEMTHSAGVGLNIEGKFGKLFALLHSDLIWSFSEGGSTASQSVGVSLRRVF